MAISLHDMIVRHSEMVLYGILIIVSTLWYYYNAGRWDFNIIVCVWCRDMTLLSDNLLEYVIQWCQSPTIGNMKWSPIFCTEVADELYTCIWFLSWGIKIKKKSILENLNKDNRFLFPANVKHMRGVFRNYILQVYKLACWNLVTDPPFFQK